MSPSPLTRGIPPQWLPFIIAGALFALFLWVLVTGEYSRR